MTQAYPHVNNYGYLWIRLATQEDVEQIIQVQLKSLQVIAARDYSSHELNALLQSKQSPRSRFELIYVAELGEQIVGFAALDKVTNHLAGLFVDPEYTRMGIGTKLLQTIENEAQRSGIKVLWICSSLTGHAFYLANNYQEMNDFNISVDGVAIPCIRLRKVFPASSKVDVRGLVSMIILIAIAFFLVLK